MTAQTGASSAPSSRSRMTFMRPIPSPQRMSHRPSRLVECLASNTDSVLIGPGGGLFERLLHLRPSGDEALRALPQSLVRVDSQACAMNPNIYTGTARRSTRRRTGAWATRPSAAPTSPLSPPPFPCPTTPPSSPSSSLPWRCRFWETRRQLRRGERGWMKGEELGAELDVEAPLEDDCDAEADVVEGKGTGKGDADLDALPTAIDPFFERFRLILAENPHQVLPSPVPCPWNSRAMGAQVLRYDRGGRPLWASREVPGDGEPPPCPLCLGPRIFEFQVLHFLQYIVMMIGRDGGWCS